MNLENKQFSPINDEKSKVIIELTEVISGKEYSFASEIYSFGMLMWEISSGQPNHLLLDLIMIITLQ